MIHRWVYQGRSCFCHFTSSYKSSIPGEVHLDIKDHIAINMLKNSRSFFVFQDRECWHHNFHFLLYGILQQSCPCLVPNHKPWSLKCFLTGQCVLSHTSPIIPGRHHPPILDLFFESVDITSHFLYIANIICLPLPWWISILQFKTIPLSSANCVGHQVDGSKGWLCSVDRIGEQQW